MARPGDALGRALRWAAGGEWVVVGMAAPVLAFPTVRPRWTAGALAALATVWVFRWAVRGEPWPVTPFNGALLLFSVMIPVGMWASAFPEFTLPKAAGLVLGLATFRAVAFAVDDGRRLGLAVAGFCLLGLGIAAVGALGTQWKATVAPLAALAEQVPRLIPTLPELRSAGINPNQLAALLTLYVPFALALAVGVPFRRGTGLAARVVWLVVLGALTAVMAGLLLLTQSRSGWMGGAAGLVALASLAGLTGRRRWARVAGAALPLVVVGAALAAVVAVGPARVVEVVVETGSQARVEEAVGSISLAGRVEIWSRALYGIQDFPFTGCGLGAFREVVHILYPLFRVSPDTDIAHAHNIFLQTALDLGLPGLVGYGGLVALAGACCWRAARRGRGMGRTVALGLAAGLVALHVYGLIDALALGAKPGVTFWYGLGLVVGTGPGAPGEERAR